MGRSASFDRSLAAALLCCCACGPSGIAAPAAPSVAPAVVAGAAAVAPVASPSVNVTPQLMAAAGASAPLATTPAITAVPPAAVSGNSAGAAAPATMMPPASTTPVTPPLTLSITVPQVAPGAEDTQCVQVKLASTQPVNVVRLHNTLTNGSHHFILTAVTDTSAGEKPLAKCQGFRGAIAGAPLTITQAHDDLVQLPDGVGYHLNAAQIMHLELHYINTGDKTLDVTATAELFLAADGAQIQEGAVLLVGTADIDLPPHQAKQNPPKYLALPTPLKDAKFYAITGHTHRFGTAVNVSSATPDMKAVAELYAPAHYDWEAPEMKQLTPHVTLPSGGGFLLSCAWNNTSDTEIKWGESATAEMCFFWGYYYPRKDIVSIVIDNLDPSIIKTL
jgi:hypothetical protein